MCEIPKYTVITGASSGLGKAFAVECAKQNRNLLLISLPGDNLGSLCYNLIMEYGIKCKYLEIDLTEQDAIHQISLWIKGKYAVNMIINNAGMGGTQSFENSPLDYLDNIIQLNVRATSLITRMLINELQKHDEAFVLNIASMAAFSPIPYKTVYPASKAFIYSFSRGLQAELDGTNVKVCVVNPGPIMTNPDVMMRIQKQGVLAKLGILSAKDIAAMSLEKMYKGKTVIVPGIFNQFNVLLMRIVPASIRLRVMGKIFKRETSNKNIEQFEIA